MKSCPDCGRENQDQAKFCVGCGHKFNNINQANRGGMGGGNQDNRGGMGGGNQAPRDFKDRAYQGQNNESAFRQQFQESPKQHFTSLEPNANNSNNSSNSSNYQASQQRVEYGANTQQRQAPGGYAGGNSSGQGKSFVSYSASANQQAAPGNGGYRPGYNVPNSQGVAGTYGGSTTITDESQLPEKFRPVSPWGYVGINFLFAIPIIGFIILLVFTFSNKNINRRNYARSFWCLLLLYIILIVIAFVIGMLMDVDFSRIGDTFSDFFKRF